MNSITKHFASHPDPRVARTRVHLLTDLITIAILAVIAGAEGWDDIETYAEAREPMLQEFLDLPGGAPSDDTFPTALRAPQPQGIRRVLHGVDELSHRLVRRKARRP